ncbi:MAG TPA: GGDEF domain-containing protein [Anaerolineales bacterium]|nr:GGDEF domain-containing protein [Anaerolineales bacterium]
MELKIKRIFDILEDGHPIFWTAAGIGSIGLLGIIDTLTGNEITFSLFYMAPIVVVTWAVHQEAGLLMSLLSALTLLGAEIAAGQTYSSPTIYVWNTLIRAVFYIIVTYLVAELHKARREEQLAARTDFVTGAANARYFHELLQMEMNRIHRYPHPITVVYIDIDNFKLVNDLFGHKIGDEVLRNIADELKTQLRRTDIVARVGGDEFALLLPSTHQPEAKVVISKVRTNLAETMKQRNWPVTLSMGAVTCVSPPHSPEQLLNMADELMYQVKNSTKNDVRFFTWGRKQY